MTKEKKEMIQARARRLAPFLADYLQNEDPSDWEKGQTYKWCYLLLKGPRAFLEQFRFADMRLCQDAIENVYWELRGEFPGGPQLMAEELRLLSDHNFAAAEYQIKQDQRRPTAAYAERGAGVTR